MKFALVTGASSGIGWHIAAELARRGYSIVAVSNQPERLSLLKGHLENTCKVSVETIDMDLASEGAAGRVFRFCQERNLEVEVLVNCAGILIYGETIGADPERVRSILQIHMLTPAMLCRLFGEGMAARGTGYILNVSSISAVMPYPTISLYGPTKAFLRKFTRALRFELRPLGIRVTCILPGATDTTINEGTSFRFDRGKRWGLVKKPENVAAAGIRALFRNRAEYIPGIFNKLTLWLVPFLPYFIIGLVYKWFYLSRRKPGR